MRRDYAAYFPLTEDSIKAVWDAGSVILDTNALLDCYRLSRSTVDQMLRVLDAVKDRLFLPRQVGLEFFRRRDEVIAEQVRTFELIRRALGTLPDTISDFKRHTVIPLETIEAALKQTSEAQIRVVNEAASLGINYLEAGSDPILARLENLFPDTRCGESNEEHDKEIQRRFEPNLAPCHWPDHKSKPNNNTHYGDCKVWLEILDHCHKSKLHILFVTSDTRQGNWWRTALFGNKPKEIGPHYSLIADVHSLHKKHLLMYTLADFLKQASHFASVSVDSNAIQEVKEVEKGREVRQHEIQKAKGQLLTSYLRDILTILSSFEMIKTELRESPKELLPTHIMTGMLRQRMRHFLQVTGSLKLKRRLRKCEHLAVKASDAVRLLYLGDLRYEAFVEAHESLKDLYRTLKTVYKIEIADLL